VEHDLAKIQPACSEAGSSARGAEQPCSDGANAPFFYFPLIRQIAKTGINFPCVFVIMLDMETHVKVSQKYE